MENGSREVKGEYLDSERKNLPGEEIFCSRRGDWLDGMQPTEPHPRSDFCTEGKDEITPCFLINVPVR